MKTYLEQDEASRLEKAATNPRDRLLIRVLSHLGCRISEAIALSVEDIDSERGTVTIQHLKTSLKLTCVHCGHRLGRSHSFCPGCAQSVTEAVHKELEHRRVRALPVDSDTLNMIRTHIAGGSPISRDCRQLIFGINRHRAWQIVRDCARRAGLGELANPETGRTRGVSPHRLRDAFAVRAVKLNDSGDGLQLLQEHLGHTSFNTTAKYRKIGSEEQRQWYDRLWTIRD